MNIVTIAGRLGADPDVRFTSNGKKVTTFRLASNTRKAGKEDTIWWRVTVWGEQFDKLISFLKKGSAIICVGELHKPEIFTDREGKPQISVEMTASSIMFSPFGKSDKPAASRESESSNANELAEVSVGSKSDDVQDLTDDEIPF